MHRAMLTRLEAEYYGSKERWFDFEDAFGMLFEGLGRSSPLINPCSRQPTAATHVRALATG